MMPHIHLMFGLLFINFFANSGIKPIFMLLFVLGCILPDIDFIYVLISKRNHRTFITHYPTLYLFGLIITVFLRFPFYWYFLGSFFHTIIDLVDFEVYLFAPFFNNSFSILRLNYDEIGRNKSFCNYLIAYYKNKKIILIEISLFLLLLLNTFAIS